MSQHRSNVVLFGEAGDGKSSVVNLILGLDVARVSSDTLPCTLDNKPHDITIQGHDFCIFESVGLYQPQSLVYAEVVNKGYRLVTYLTATKGIDLLVFCIRRGKVSTTMEQNYRLFYDFLCHKKVPVVLVVTHLEYEENMESWWSHNHPDLKETGIHVVGHACITAKRQFADKYHASRQIVHDLLVTHGCETASQRGANLKAESRSKVLGLVGSHRLDSARFRAQKLREFGLREEDIKALQIKLDAIDEDLVSLRPQSKRSSVLARLRSRRSAPQEDTEIETHTTTATDSNDNRSDTVTADPLIDETSNLDHEQLFPNDLTSLVKREGSDPVASGGFADIYRGTLQSNAKPTKIAIKAIKTYSGEDGDVTKKEKRLRREVKVWLSLQHENVLPLFGTAMGFSRFPAMVCPWAENGTLTSYLKDRYADLSVAEIFGLLDNVASGLQYLHSLSVVHGDLSGSNILIIENGSACIADFGLSTLLTELGGLTFATSFHARGTIRWMAPELLDLTIPEDELEEKPNVSPMTHSDVYSFGGVMLQILSGKVPYHYYSNEMQVVHAVSRGIKPKRPSNVVVTEHRWAFIQRCWSTDDITRSRPTSDEISEFTKGELPSIGTA